MGFAVRTYTSGNQYLQSSHDRRPGCLVAELKTADVPGIALIEELSKSPVATPVIVLTAHADVQSAVRAMRLGVVAFLQKQSLSETALWEALHHAVDLDSQRRAARARREDLLARAKRLTADEAQVLQLLVEGEDHTTIAEQLDISRRTVENRRAKLMNKLGVSTFPQLIRLAVEAGLFPSAPEDSPPDC
jgi:FixJ family two-component response regulator